METETNYCWKTTGNCWHRKIFRNSHSMKVLSF